MTFFLSGGEEVVDLVGVTTASPVVMEGEGDATGAEAATEGEEGDTITVGRPAMAPVTGGTEYFGAGRRDYDNILIW